MNKVADSGLLWLNGYSSISDRLIRVVNLLAGRDPDTYQSNIGDLKMIKRPDLLDMFGVRWLIADVDAPTFTDATFVERVG